MKELLWTGSGTARWRETEDPPAPVGPAALVRPLAVACCDLDVWTVHGTAPLDPPFRVGHEGVAEVVAVGAEVIRIRPGDRVVVPFQISCGECATCRRGRTESCDAVPLMAMYGMGPLAGLDGGGFLSDFVHVPFADAMLVQLPEGVDAVAAASVSDNVVDGWRGIGPYLSELDAVAESDRRMLVTGYGSIGLYAVAAAVAVGVDVDYVDDEPARLEVARRLGANPVDGLLPGRELTPYPITMSTRPARDWLLATIRATWPGGVCTDAAVHFGPDLALPLLAMYTRGIRYVTGRVPARAAIPAALGLLASSKLQTTPIARQTVVWDDADTVWPRMTGKTIFVRQ